MLGSSSYNISRAAATQPKQINTSGTCLCQKIKWSFSSLQILGISTRAPSQDGKDHNCLMPPDCFQLRCFSIADKGFFSALHSMRWSPSPTPLMYPFLLCTARQSLGSLLWDFIYNQSATFFLFNCANQLYIYITNSDLSRTVCACDKNLHSGGSYIVIHVHKFLITLNMYS